MNHRTGRYEALVTKRLYAWLQTLQDDLAHRTENLDDRAVAEVVAHHVASMVGGVLSRAPASDRAALAEQLVSRITDVVSTVDSTFDPSADTLTNPVSLLTSIHERRLDGRERILDAPHLPLRATSLITHAAGEPRIVHHLQSEIASSDAIDVVMAFIRMSGVNPLRDALTRHVQSGKTVRVLTTIFTGTTDVHALDALTDLGAQVRVSYDVSSTRLHAKAWVFHRHSGYSTAYVGSSNLTYSAQQTGLEWNVRASTVHNRDVVRTVSDRFESYWNSGEFRAFDRDEFLAQLPRAQTVALHVGAPPAAKVVAEDQTTVATIAPVLVARPFQASMLEKLRVARQRGMHRNLLVSATGTGKTVMSALDYVHLQGTLPRARLLFVAHRREILDQALATFRQATRDPTFGELWVGGRRPSEFEHVFASIQSLTAHGVTTLDPTHFDVVIVDEFHHAAAPTYRALLQHLQPTELLGMTATPERGDGTSIASLFEDRIAAELRLWEAIEEQWLAPFHYYGVNDGTDLSRIPWRRGRGYDIDHLENLYTGNHVWARLVADTLVKRTMDPTQVKALGFCVSVAHARFMAQEFTRVGIPAVAVSGSTHQDDREDALADLADGRVKVVFAVDLFNEGVDVPQVNTLLLLRPTDSPLLFMQQLGRGLRLHESKDVCTILDFVGQHAKEYRIDLRYQALLGGTRAALQSQVEHGFPSLPAGCHMELDRVAQDTVLRSLKNLASTSTKALAQQLRLWASHGAGQAPSLKTFLRESHLSVFDLYGPPETKRSTSGGWSDLLEQAGFDTLPHGPSESDLRAAASRLTHINDLARIRGYREVLLAARNDRGPRVVPNPRFQRMLLGSLLAYPSGNRRNLAQATAFLGEHPQVIAEILDLLDVLEDHVEHITPPLSTHPDVPLSLHARYSRVEILAGFGLGDLDSSQVNRWQSGVQWVQRAKADILPITMDKSASTFNDNTRYRDYAISRSLIHWESQSTTAESSDTGKRYQHHETLGTHIMLFARHSTSDRAYTFLGPAQYVRHEGERPMAITWRLDVPMPHDLFASLVEAVA